MTLTDDEISSRLETRILNFRRDSKAEINRVRRARIDEAISWPGGPSTDDPEKHVVETLPGGIEAYFLKPGKEADRSDPNPHDMAPRVGSLYDDYRFDETWAEIASIALADFRMFEHFLVLVYRNAYLLDHEDVGNGQIRYRPDTEVVDTIDDAVGDTINGDVRTLLHFLDLLGWNEDVKYHGGSRDYDLGADFYTGRINTVLTCLDVPYRLAGFIDEVVENADDPQNIDVLKGLETMQDLSTTRGVSTPTQGELEEWFSPVLYR